MAACLDGSSPGYYFYQGFGDGQDKFYIYLQGGARCEGNTREEYLESCYKKSQTALGSSKFWSIQYANDANLSEKEEENPLFYNWNKVFINYCDGSLYQGSAEPIEFNGSLLYFRGYDNMAEIFSELIEQKFMDRSQIVVLAGGSAGGLGSFYWNQYLRKILPSSVNVIAAPDSGFFLDIPKTDHSSVPMVFDLITDGNRDLIQPEGCPYLYDDKVAYKCVYAQYILDLMPVPVFIINSLYDTYTLKNILGVTCVTNTFGLQNCSNEELLKINFLRDLTLKELKNVQTTKPDWGLWTISCPFHVFSQLHKTFNSQSYDVPENSVYSPAVALKEFIEDKVSSKPRGFLNLQPNHFHFDNVEYPNNRNCNGLPTFEVN